LSETNPAAFSGNQPSAEDVMSFLDSVLNGSADAILPPELVQKLFTVAVRHYSRAYEDGFEFPPMLREHINATDVSTCCIEMLHVVDLEVFELTFWGGRLQDTRGYDNR
jgi:hypothetical protein